MDVSNSTSVPYNPAANTPPPPPKPAPPPQSSAQLESPPPAPQPGQRVGGTINTTA